MIMQSCFVNMADVIFLFPSYLGSRVDLYDFFYFFLMTSSVFPFAPVSFGVKLLLPVSVVQGMGNPELNWGSLITENFEWGEEIVGTRLHSQTLFQFVHLLETHKA